jgi:hypothetical protein
MAARTVFLVPATLLLTSIASLAQTPSPVAPADVDQALRARVTEFFQDFVDGKYRQAINLVAEDTQDEYFSSPKAELKSFKIEQIDYSTDFTKASVQLTVKQVWKLKAEGFLQDQVVDAPMSTTWRTEQGKWVFFHKVDTNGWLTPMGPSAPVRRPDGSPVIPQKLDDATLGAEAARLLSQTGSESGVDKREVTLSYNRPSSVKVVYHNGAQGSVNISLVGLTNLPGFSAMFDKPVVDSGKDGILEISYTPSPDLQSPPRAFTIAVDIAPFGREYPIDVRFVADAK